MSFTKAKGPDHHCDDGARNVDQLGGEIDPDNKPNALQLQAPPLLADTAGQSDHDYFVAHPNIDHRVRLPIEGEFPAGLIEQGRGLTAFVHVLIIRNSDGSPATRARGIFFSEGGHA